MLIKTTPSPIYKIQSLLPQSVSLCLSGIDEAILESITELRLRRNGIVTATIDGKNCMVTKCGLEKKSSVPCKITAAELEEFIYKACNGSVYSHEKSLGEFFISTDGIRIGIGGVAGFDGKIKEITGVNIRLPHHVDGCSAKALDYIEKNGLKTGKGLLVISPPGVGKTTLLRDMAHKLSSGKYGKNSEMLRVTVIDERQEIYMPNLFDNCCIDFISGTDKIVGIEKALRLLSPQVIICDEISGMNEAEKISTEQNRGVLFIASYHAGSVSDALKRDFIRNMLDDGVFGGICSLKRNEKKIEQEIYIYEENNA